jgi:cytochrome c biogenesis protein CcmG, thiol:disulfide interchange protein DsbE
MTARLVEPLAPGARAGFDLRRLGRRHLVVAAVMPLILLTLWGAMLVARGGASPTAIGSVAPDFELVDLDGKAVHLSALHGRPVIVNFWASWCVPCAEEFPLLREANERYSPDGLVVIGIIYQDRSMAASQFMQRHDAAWIGAADPEGSVAERYGVLGPPETFLIGRDGRIEARALGQFTADWLDSKVAAIMEE